MTRLFLFIGLAFVSLNAFAQNDDYRQGEVRTIFPNNKGIGAYGALSIGYTQMGTNDALIAGARGAISFNRSVAIGLGGYGFMDNLQSHSGTNFRDEMSLAGGYGGIFVEPILGSQHAVHLSFPVLFGLGGVALVHTNDRLDFHNNDYVEYDNDLFFVIEPGVELEFNLTRNIRAAAFITYRITSDVELYQTEEDVLQTVNLGMTLKFGKF